MPAVAQGRNFYCYGLPQIEKEALLTVRIEQTERNASQGM